MLLFPIGTVLEQEPGKLGVSTKHGMAQRRGLPVTTPDGNWPAELDQQHYRGVAALRRQFTQQRYLRFAQCRGKVGLLGLQASGSFLITARTGGKEALVCGDPLGCDGLSEQISNLGQRKSQGKSIAACPIWCPCRDISTARQQRGDV